MSSMHYLALLFADTDASANVGGGAMNDRYRTFQEFAGDAIAWGAALHSPKEAVTVRHPGGEPLITDGPFTEANEVVNGAYVLTADDLDSALEIARRIPAAEDCAVELWPTVMWYAKPDDTTANHWVALLRNPGGGVPQGTPEWDAGAAEHGKFGEAAGEAIRGGAALHPASAATTVRSRDGELLLSDGPYAETNEIVNGLYLLAASSPAEAGELAAQIPVGDDGVVELRRVVVFEA
jgi:hypothetical protein